MSTNAFCPMGRRIFPAVISALGLDGNRFKRLSVRLNLDIDAIVTADVTYTEVIGEGEAQELVDVCGKPANRQFAESVEVQPVEGWKCFRRFGPVHSQCQDHRTPRRCFMRDGTVEHS